MSTKLGSAKKCEICVCRGTVNVSRACALAQSGQEMSAHWRSVFLFYVQSGNAGMWLVSLDRASSDQYSECSETIALAYSDIGTLPSATTLFSFQK